MISPNFWNTQNKGKPSKELKKLISTVDSPTSANALIDLMKVEESEIYEEKERIQFTLSKIRVYLMLYEKFKNTHRWFSEQLEIICWENCSMLETEAKQHSAIMKGAFLFRTAQIGSNGSGTSRLIINLTKTIDYDNYFSLSQFPYWFLKLANDLKAELKEDKNANYHAYWKLAVDCQLSLIIKYPCYKKATSEVLEKLNKIGIRKYVVTDYMVNKVENRNYHKKKLFLEKHLKMSSTQLTSKDFCLKEVTKTPKSISTFPEYCFSHFHWVLCKQNDFWTWKLLQDALPGTIIYFQKDKQMCICVQKFREDSFEIIFV